MCSDSLHYVLGYNAVTKDQRVAIDLCYSGGMDWRTALVLIKIGINRTHLDKKAMTSFSLLKSIDQAPLVAVCRSKIM